MSLFDMQCRAAKPKEKPYKLSDGEGQAIDKNFVRAYGNE